MTSEILATGFDESWTRHFQLGLAIVLNFTFNSCNDGTHQNSQKCPLDSSN